MRKQATEITDGPIKSLGDRILMSPKIVPLSQLLYRIERTISDKKATNGDLTADALRTILPDLRNAIAAGIPLLIAHHAMQVGALIERASLWPYVKRGMQGFDGAESGGNERKRLEQDKWNKWQTIATEIWSSHPEYTIKRVAKDVFNRLHGDPDRGRPETIRKHIKKSN